MTLLEIFSILFIHWVGDFVLQTDYQAKNKSKDSVVLTEHVLCYTLVWLFVLLIYNSGVFTWESLFFVLITFVTHYITDYFTSRLNTHLWNKRNVHNFFVSVGFDQFLHYLQLFLTFKYLFNG